MVDNGNGNRLELPEDRKAAVEAGLTHYQMVSAERDGLAKEIAQLKSEIATLKVVAEAQRSQINEMESRATTHLLTRDQAVADRAKYETLFIAFQSMLRAFKVPAAPLVKEMKDETETRPDSANKRHDGDYDYKPVRHEMPYPSRS